MAEEIARAVLATEADMSNFTAGMAEGKAAAKSFEAAAVKAGGAVGDAIGKGTGAAGAGTDKLDATTRRFLNTLERESQQAGRTRSEFLQLRAAQLGVSDTTGVMIARIRDAERGIARVGMSSKATAAALRQVPAQLTDIVTSLQGGQAPLTVLLQQGGQLKDMFGGVVPAARALGSTILGLVNPYTLAATAAVGLGAAYFQGSREADAFARSIILTGNAVGLTTDQLQMMAAGIAGVVGTQATASEALAQFAASGNIAAGSLQQFTTTAIQAQRLTGKAVADTVKEFEELGKSPVEASIKLNLQYRFLTLSVLDQIKALEQQGRATEAANLAQRTYDEAMASRLGRLQDRLGTIERLWRDVRDGATKAWDAILNVGRPDTGADRLADLQGELERRQARGPLNPATADAFETGNQRLREQIALLQSDQREKGKLAELEGERARTTAAAIEAEREIDRIRKASATNQQKLNDELATYRRNIEAIRRADPTSALLDAGKIKADEAAIRARFRDKGGDSAARGERRSLVEFDVSAIKANLEAVTGAYRNAESILEAVRSAGLVSEGDYYAAKIAFIRLNEAAQAGALAAENERLAKEKVNGKDRIDNDRKIAENEAKIAAIRANASAQIVTLNIREQASQDALTRSYIESQRAAEQYLQAFQLRQDRAVQAVGQGGTQRGFNAGLTDIEDRFTERRAQLERERRTGLFKDNAEAYERELALLEQTKSAELAIYVRGFDAIQAAQGDFSNGAARALEDYLEAARNVAQSTNELFSNAFKGMEDALVQFIQTGKLDFKSLADTIVAELLRIIVKQQLANAVAASAPYFSGGGVGGFIGQVAGALLGSVTGGGSGMPDDVPTRGGRANGGPVEAGQAYMTGEFGPELFVPRSAGQIIPAGATQQLTSGNRSTVNNITVNVPQGINRATGQQIAAEVGRRLSVAGSRGN